jgi:uncharacterized protein YciI
MCVGLCALFSFKGMLMLLIVQFVDVYADQPERLPERDALMSAHLQFLESLGNQVVASGALRDTGDGVPRGGLWILNMDSKAAAEALYKEDPFWKAGLRKTVSVSLWSKAVWSPAFSDCMDTIGNA